MTTPSKQIQIILLIYYQLSFILGLILSLPSLFDVPTPLIDRLLQYVNDAIWRLELLTGVVVSSDACQVPQGAHISSTEQTQCDWIYASEESESEDEGGRSSSTRAQKLNHKRTKSEVERSSESGSQSNRSAGWCYVKSHIKFLTFPIPQSCWILRLEFLLQISNYPNSSQCWIGIDPIHWLKSLPTPELNECDIS